jgi:hypothetical protein
MINPQNSTRKMDFQGVTIPHNRPAETVNTITPNDCAKPLPMAAPIAPNAGINIASSKRLSTAVMPSQRSIVPCLSAACMMCCGSQYKPLGNDNTAATANAGIALTYADP